MVLIVKNDFDAYLFNLDRNTVIEVVSILILSNCP